MAKNYADIYNSVNDSTALEQKFFIKEEVTRGVLNTPLGSDFIYIKGGASVNFKQETESSTHKSGRHNTSIIKKKTSTEWTIPLSFNINESLGAISLAEIDPAARVLYKSLLGKEDVTSGGLVYNSSSNPSTTFSIFEIGDQWSKQASGAYVESGTINLVGDGDSNVEYSGMAKYSVTVGMSKTVVDNAANTITVAANEGICFPVGSQIMLIKSDGVTRSGDTPDGSPRTVTSVTGDVLTVDGAALTDADGSASDIYVVYYEPETAVAINNEVTGLQGSITIVGLSSSDCVRSATIAMTNNHEPQDYCYGSDGLAGRIFTNAGRLNVEVSFELNLNKEIVCKLNQLREFQGDDITFILGDATGRHMQVTTPKVIASIPEISVPDTGSIPISFSGIANQTAIDAADEIEIKFL